MIDTKDLEARAADYAKRAWQDFPEVKKADLQTSSADWIAGYGAALKDGRDRDAQIRDLVLNLRGDENYYPTLERILALLKDNP